MNLVEIEKSFSKLSLKDLRYLKTKIEFLIAYGDKKEENQDLEFFYEVVKGYLIQKYGLRYPEFYIFRKQAKTLIEPLGNTLEQLKEFLKDIEGVRYSRENLTKTQRLFVELSCKYLQNINVPISIKSIVNVSHLFSSLVDEAFPGYSSSSLLSMVINKR